MTPCARIDALLELSTEQLGHLDGDNAEHVSTCASCRSAVERILETERVLNEALSTHPPLDVDAVLARAATDGPLPRTSRVRSIGRRGYAVLAAAAAVAALLLVRPPPPTPSTANLTRNPGVSTTPPTLVAEGDVAVLATRNPDITVVWFFTGD